MAPLLRTLVLNSEAADVLDWPNPYPAKVIVMAGKLGTRPYSPPGSPGSPYQVDEDPDCLSNLIVATVELNSILPKLIIASMSFAIEPPRQRAWLNSPLENAFKDLQHC